MLYKKIIMQTAQSERRTVCLKELISQKNGSEKESTVFVRGC